MAKTPRPVIDAGVHIGQVFLGKYRVEELLGQGGMGVVARCTHLLTDAQVAIKMLRHDVLTDHDATQRFTREAQAATKLRSEYVAKVHDAGTLETGVPYMVMEFLDGHDLGALIDQQGQVAVPWAVELMLQAAEALAEAHSINIVHRDVKPTNLFVTWRPDGTSLIKVLDFGISKSSTGVDMQLTQTQSLLGTPAYMSPEQMRSARLVDARTDIWSLGTVMYELLEGHRPFEADSFSEMCVKVAVDPPAPMRNTPPALQQVVLRCLAKTPEQRYASMADLGRDLIPFARDPHWATLLVERMTRMLGRSAIATPIPGAIRDIKSGPIARPSPPAWHGGSDHAIPLADPNTLREKSAPAMQLPTAAPSRSRLAVVIAFLMTLAVAGAIAFVVTREGDQPAAAAAEPAEPSTASGDPAPVEPPDRPANVVPPPVTPDAVAPATADTKADTKDDTKADVKSDVAATKTETPVRKHQKQKTRPIRRVERTKPADKPKVDKTDDKAPAKDDKDKLVDPTQNKPKVDVFSTPRPERK